MEVVLDIFVVLIWYNHCLHKVTCIAVTNHYCDLFKNHGKKSANASQQLKIDSINNIFKGNDGSETMISLMHKK